MYPDQTQESAVGDEESADRIALLRLLRASAADRRTGFWAAPEKCRSPAAGIWSNAAHRRTGTLDETELAGAACGVEVLKRTRYTSSLSRPLYMTSRAKIRPHA